MHYMDAWPDTVQFLHVTTSHAWQLWVPTATDMPNDGITNVKYSSDGLAFRSFRSCTEMLPYMFPQKMGRRTLKIPEDSFLPF